MTGIFRSAARGEEAAGRAGGCVPGTGCTNRQSRVDRAGDGDVVAVLGACGSARDRLIVLLMVRAGLRRGEVLGLRRSDVHLLADSRAARAAGSTRPHLHVVRRENNVNGAIAKSRRQRAVPLDFLTVQAFDTYEFERMTVPAAASGDFVFVNLFRGTLGAPMRLDAVNDLVGAAARRAGIDPAPRPHQLRHAFASNVLDAGGTLEETQDLLGHASIASTQVYTHPDPARLRAAVDAVPSPRAASPACRRTWLAPADLLAYLRGHWAIEMHHYVRSPGVGLAVASCGADATRVSFSC